MFYVTKKNWDKILGYAEEAYNEHKSEIGGMSVMVEDKEGNWELQDPVILKQEISSGNTVLEKEALAEYYTKKAMKMKKHNFRFCWWHSHHKMNAFWSGTDITAIEEFSDGDFSFALVVNLKDEYKFRVSMWKPFEVHQDIKLNIIGGSRCTKAMAKEVEELCSSLITGYSYNINRNGTSRVFTNHVYNRNQGSLPLSMPTKTSEVKDNDFNNQFTNITMVDVADAVDELNDELTEGAIDYKQYSSKINKLNKVLAKENSIYKVTLIPENKVNELLYMWPNTLIVYRKTGEQVYDDSFYYGGY